MASRFDHNPDSKHIMAHLLNAESSSTGCNDMDTVSLSQFCNFNELPGPDTKIPGGYQQILDYLSQQLPAQTMLKKKVVSSIDWKGPNVVTSCDDGSTFHSDAVVFTGSLGVLKAQHHAMFQPGLSSAKGEAITKLDIGTVAKIFAFFPNLDFLDSTTVRLQFVWDKELAAKYLSVDQLWMWKINFAVVLNDHTLQCRSSCTSSFC